jgi:hypothetical protein
MWLLVWSVCCPGWALTALMAVQNRSRKNVVLRTIPSLFTKPGLTRWSNLSFAENGLKAPSNCIFCQAQPNPCYSWAKLTLSSISLAIWAAQHWIYAAQHICAVLHVYGLHNIAYELHNLSYGLHNIAYRLQNIAYGLHNIACRLHNIVPLGK